MTRTLPHLSLAAALLAATALLASRLPIPEDRPYDVAVIPPSKILRWLTLGHPTLAANLYYLRAVQYIGEPRANQRGWEKLHPVLDLVTDLDPRHGYAYQVGGTLLGSVDRVAESNALLEKGMRNVPARYILPYLRAFNAFYYDGDYAAAGRFTEMAASVPGAPPHLRVSAVAMDVKGGQAEAAIQFLQNLRNAAQDKDSVKALDDQLRQAYLERGAAEIEAALAAHRQRQGSAPGNLRQLVREGLLRALPTEPFGGNWTMGEDGRVHSSVHAFRYSPPDFSHRRVEPPIHDREE